MAVQAQYLSNILLLNRNVQEGKNNPSGGYLDQSHLVINDNKVGVNNSRKRTRSEVASTTPNTTTHNMNINTFDFSLQNQNQIQLIDISELHNNHHNNNNNNQQQQQQHRTNVVSTGLGLSFGDQNQQQHLQHHHQQQHQRQVLPQKLSSLSSSASLLSIVSEDFAIQLKQQSDEIHYFLHVQGEQLRRTLAEKRQKHYRALLSAAEEAVTKQLREKETEVEKAAIRNAELEAKWAQLNAEAQSWRAQAQAQEAQAATLQAQINQAITTNSAHQQDRERTGLTCAGGGDVADSESAYVDPVSERRVNSTPSCKVCRTRGASVVILPCRHLCVCTGCDGVVQACPVCLATRSASLQVYLS